MAARDFSLLAVSGPKAASSAQFSRGGSSETRPVRTVADEARAGPSGHSGPEQDLGQIVPRDLDRVIERRDPEAGRGWHRPRVQPSGDGLVAVEAGAGVAVGVGPDAMPVSVDLVQFGVWPNRVIELGQTVGLPVEGIAGRGLEAHLVTVEAGVPDPPFAGERPGGIRKQ